VILSSLSMPDPRTTTAHGRRWWAAFGVLGPLVFVAAVVAAGAVTPGYDQATRFLSELGETGAATAPWVNAALVAVGVCLLGFAWSIGGRAGALLAVAALGFAFMAGSPCSPGCPIAVVNAKATASDALHNAAAIAAIAGIGFAALELGTSSWFRTPRWYRAYSTASGIGIALTSTLFLLAVIAANPLSIGVAERAMVVIGLLWVETTAWIRVLGASERALDGEKYPKAQMGHFLV
jgi:hypothetical membrane protein